MPGRAPGRASSSSPNASVRARGRSPARNRNSLSGDFRRRLVRRGQDHRALAVRTAIECDALARLHIWVQPLAIAPARLLAVNDRPAQAARLVIRVERREVVAVPAAETRVLLEQPLLDVEAEICDFLVFVACVELG